MTDSRRLLELGRDREAARLGARRPTIDQEAGGTMETLEQLDQLGPVLAGVVERITPDQLDNPTPCAEFTVRGVLEHMVGGATAFTAAFRGEAPPAGPLPDDLLGAFGPALGGLAEAIHAPGALERTIQAPFGEISGDGFARFVVLDGVVHGWDLATATGQPYDPPAALVTEARRTADATLDGLRDGSTFKDAVVPAADATPVEQLAAYTGRNPEVHTS